MIQKIASYLVTTSLTFTLLNGSDNFEDFLNVIEETTQIATKNKMNAQWAPGVISILKHDELKRMGARNLNDALKFIPNVTINMDEAGNNAIIIRGIGGVLGSGKTKILINGVSQNGALMAICGSNLPIDVIDRIEVLRGPGSVLYGEFALNGTINIITKKDESSLFYNYTQLQNNSAIDMGATFFQKDEEFEASGIVYYTNTDGLEPYTKDNYGNGHNVETLREEKVLISTMAYRDLLFKVTLNELKAGEHFGADKALPDNDGDYNFKTKREGFELSNQFRLNDSIRLIPRYHYHKYESDIEMTKFSGQYSNAPYMSYNSPYNIYEKHLFGADLHLYYGENKFLVGVEHANVEEKDNSLTLVITNPFTNLPISTSTTSKDKSKRNKRTTDTIYFQQVYKPNDSFIFSGGVRYESYDDKINQSLDDYFVPKLSMVYLKDIENVYKVQYGKANRVNTFLENKESNPIDVKPETIDTVELQHSFFKKETKVATTLFYSEIKDLIIQKSNSQQFWFENEKKNIVSQGFELEYSNKLFTNYYINSNISYTEAFYKDSKKDIGDYSNILGNMAITYNPYALFSSSIVLDYIGSKKRTEADTRDDFKATTTIDMNFRYQPKDKLKDLDIVFGIKNITNETLKAPSSVGTISEDYVQKRRSYYIGLKYKL